MKAPTTLVPGTTRAVLRFLGVAAVMLCCVMLLAVVECLVLWKMGIEYTPLQRPVGAAVVDLKLVRGGQRAVSCVLTRYRSSQLPLEYSVVWHDFRTPGRPERLPLRCNPRRIAAPASFAWVAVLEVDGAIRLFPDPRRPENWKLRDSSRAQFPEIAGAPNGRMFAAATGTQVLVWNTENGEILRSWPHTCGECVCLAFCQRSRELTAVGGNGVVQRSDAVTGEVLWRRRIVQEPIQHAAVSPQGDRIFWCSYFGSTTGAVDAATGEELWRHVEGDCDFSQARMTVSPDGALVASALRLKENCCRIVVREATSGIVTAEVGEHKEYICGIVFDGHGGLYAWDLAGEVVRWELRTGRETWRFSPRCPHESAVL